MKTFSLTVKLINKAFFIVFSIESTMTFRVWFKAKKLRKEFYFPKVFKCGVFIYLCNLIDIQNLTSGLKRGKRQFGGTNSAEDNSTGQICRRANLSASQFVGEPIWQENEKEFTFTSVEATTKKFCYVINAIKKAIAIVQLIKVKIRIQNC